MSNCATLWKQTKDTSIDTFCQSFSSICPNCKCETSSVAPPEISLGPVEDSETLIRIIFSPLHMNSEGEIQANAFSDLKTHGLSVDRLSHTSLEGIKELHETSLNDTKKTQLLYAQANVSDLRSIQTEEDKAQGFGVYDAAVPDNPSHAEVCQAVFISRATDKRLRRSVQKKFSNTPQCFD